MEILLTCPICGKTHTVSVDFEEYCSWAFDGELAQNAFPTMSATDREKLISGMCEDCQNDIFGGEDDEDCFE